MIRFSKFRTAAYLLLLAGTLVWASFRGGSLPFMCLGTVILYIPVSAFLILYSSLSLEIYQELPDHRVEKLKANPWRLTIQNVGFLRVNDIEMIMEEERSSTEFMVPDPIKTEFMGSGTKALYTLLPGERLDIHGTTVCRYAGSFDIGLLKVGLHDPFALVTFCRRVPASFRVTSLPRITDMAGEILDFENMKNARRMKSMHLTEPIPANTVRSYVKGDPMHRIHWKASAASGELLTRLPDEMDTREIYLFLEADDLPHEKRDIGFTVRRDYFLEFAVSAAWYFAEKGEPLTILYPRGSIKTALVGSEDTFRTFFEDISRGPFYNGEPAKLQLKDEEKRIFTEHADALVIKLTEAEYPKESFLSIRDAD